MSDPANAPDDSDRLLPCPFCGGTAEIVEVETGAVVAECQDCKASSAMHYACGDNPVPMLLEKWNRRATSADGNNGGEKP